MKQALKIVNRFLVICSSRQSILDNLNTEYVFVEDDSALDWGLHKVMVKGRQSRVNHDWNEEEK